MSFSHRYLITLLSNIIRAGLNFLVSIALARYLLPEQYGNYQYLVAIFSSILLFANMGTEKAYFTFISEKKRSFKFHLIYYFWQLGQIIILMLFFMLLSKEWVEWILQGVDATLIFVALTALFMSGTVQVTINHMFESIRKTAHAQLLSIGIAILHMVLMLYFILDNSLSIELIFQIIIFEYLIYILTAVTLLKNNKTEIFNDQDIDVKHILKEFYHYSKPLFVYMLIAFLYTFFDRWLIQKYVGSEGQAFFAIAIQFSTLSILISASVLKIFWKEISESIKKNQLDLVRKYFLIISNEMFIFTTLIAITLFFFSKEIIYTFYGDLYLDSLLVFQLIMLYTIPQSLGQLYATYFMATSQTALYTKLAYMIMLVGFPFSFYLLSDFGLHLSEAGIAVKMLTLNIISNIILEYYISKHLNIRMYLFRKLMIIMGLTLLTFFVYSLVTYITDYFIVQMLLVVFLYILPIIVYIFKNLKKGL